MPSSPTKPNKNQDEQPSKKIGPPITIEENISPKKTQPISTNDYSYVIQDNIKFHYGHGAKDQLKSENFLYNFKFYHYLEKLQASKFVSAGFNSVADFLKIVKPVHGKYYIYEYIFEGKPCKPYFDYELMLNNKPTENSKKVNIIWLILNISHLFLKKYQVNLAMNDILFTDSSDFKGDQYKLSLHISVDSNFVFKNNKECSYIAKDLYKLSTGFDQSVYSKDRMMRCVFSAKNFNDQRVLKPLDKNGGIQDINFNLFYRYLITTVPNNYQTIELLPLEKKTSIYKTMKSQNKKEIKKIVPFLTPDAKIEKMVSIIQDKFHEDAYYTKDSFIDSATKYKMYAFNYLDRSDKCFTGNVHERIGFYCYIDNFANVIVKCFSVHCKDQKYIVGNLNDTNDDKEDYIKINRKYILPQNCSLEEQEDEVVKKLIELHKSKKLKSLGFWSAMGTGKSFGMNYTSRRFFEGKRILMISTRQSYSNNMIKEFEDLGFVNYLDDKYWYTKDRIIVQLESLHFLLRNLLIPQFDFIILDECESILYQFSSETMGTLAKDTFDLLLYLCTSENTKIMALDADWGIRSNLFLKSIGKCQVIHNQYMDVDRIILFTGNYEYFIKQIMEAIDKGENIAIVGLCTRKLEEIAQMLKEKDIKYVIHTRNTGDPLKKELKNVNEFWKKFQVVLFSPTISVGVDFSVEHFDKIFSYVIPNTASSRIYGQMLGRVRKIKHNNILTYYENITTKVDQYIYNYEELEDYFKFASTDSFLHKTLTRDQNGGIYHVNHIGLFEQIMIYNHIENLNKCGQYFMTSLNLICMKKNYRLQFLDDRKPKEEEKGNDVFKQKIIDSKDIDQNTCNIINTKIKTNCASEDEKYCLYKYKIQKFWGVKEIDQAFLDTYFRKERILVNLKYILEKDMTSIPDEYIDEHIIDKTEVIQEIVKGLGFDLNDLDRVLDKDDFYDNKKKLLTNSPFAKNYDKVRILFGKPKGVLTNLAGNFLIIMLNSYLNEFGLELVCNLKKKRVGKTVIRDSKYTLKVLNVFDSYL